MSIEIRTEPRDGYLYVVATGRFELGDAMGTTQKILDACIEQKRQKVLIDVRPLEGELSTLERWEYASDVARQHLAYVTSGRLHPVQLAYVASTPLLDPQRFGETVGLNRGLNVKAHTDFDEALQWLGVEPVFKAAAPRDQ